MQNSSPAINTTNIKLIPVSVKSFFLLIFFLVTILNAYSQIELLVPQEFQNVSINSRALEKTVEINVDKNNSLITQNIALDKTGFILHIVPLPKIKDETIKLKIISNEGEEITTYQFTDNNLFALLDPEKTYSVVQEINPECNNLSSVFGLTTENAICPDKEAFKILENIMLLSDTSIKIKLKKPVEFYKIPFLIQRDTQQTGLVSLVNIIKPRENFQKAQEAVSEEESNPDNIEQEPIINTIDLGNIVDSSNLCIISSLKKVQENETIKCSFYNENIKSIINFKNDLTKILSASGDLSFVVSLLFNQFKFQDFTLVLDINKELTPQADSIEINNDSIEKFIFDNHKYNLTLVLGELDKVKEKIGKKIFGLTNAISINQKLSKISFLIPFQKLEAIIKPYKSKGIESFFTNLTIEGKSKNITSNFNLSIDNNIVVKNLIESTPTPTPAIPERIFSKNNYNKSEQFEQTTNENHNLEIITFLPEDNYNLTLSRTFTFVDENKGPIVDEMGKLVTVVNNKSRGDLIFTDKYDEATLTKDIASLTLEIEPASSTLTNKDFNKIFGISGFLIPPDFRPVLEDGYRAAIEVSMIFTFKNENQVKINYLDIKTKDETPLVNFFNFSFLPEGTYEANIRFDSDRENLFQMAGILAPDNENK